MLGQMMRGRRRESSGFTLIELAVGIVVAGVLLGLAVPALFDFILLQRLRGINAQLVTDLQYARSEAVSRGQYARLQFGIDDSSSVTCYVIFTSNLNRNRCDCLTSANSTCDDGAEAVRTVRLPKSDNVQLRLATRQATGFAYDHIAGGIVSTPSDRTSTPITSYRIEAFIDDERVLRNTINSSGRVLTCTPTGLSGATPC